MGRKFSSKKIVLERNKGWAAVFQLLGALNLPPSPSALFCPASALPARGFFCARMFAICFSPRLVGGRRRVDPVFRESAPGETTSTVRELTGEPPSGGVVRREHKRLHELMRESVWRR